jgi:SAM-dependent methyltransferase
MARFDPASYERYRVGYPAGLFAPLNARLGPLLGQEPHIADLGAGTGISAASFLAHFPEVGTLYLSDPDPRMLDQADLAGKFAGSRVERICSPAESFACPVPLDGVLIGSAWHWMDPHAVLDRMVQVLKPGGFLMVFEYQFPKAVGHGKALELNEWVRRQFNQVWRAPGQIPRGAFHELLEPVRRHRDFAWRGGKSLIQTQSLEAVDFEGVIVSQSRFLAHEAALLWERRASDRAALRRVLEGFWMGSAQIPFEYRFEAQVFVTRPV